MVSTSAQASSSRVPITPTRPSIKGKERAVQQHDDPSIAILERKKRKLAIKYPDASASTIEEKARRWYERQEKLKQERIARALAVGVPVDELESGDEAVQGQAYKAWEWASVAEKVEDAGSPVWSNDGRFHFIASGNQILIHESSPPDYTLTGTLPSSTQSSISHTSRITSFQLHPSNPLQIITASEDGTVKVWSWTDGTLIRTLDVAEALHTQQKKGEDEEGKRGKIVRMAAGVEGGKVFVYAVVDAASREYQILSKVVKFPIRLPTTPGPHGQSIPGNLSKHLTRLGQINQSISSISISPHGTFVALTTASGVYLRKLAGGKTNTDWIEVETEVAVTCLRWCPADQVGTISVVKKGDEEWFATGDKGGVVRLYRGGLNAVFKSLNPDGKHTTATKDSWVKIGATAHAVQLASTAMHWHSHPVHALCFTPFGGQLLSGGEENVLVTWHLDTLKPSFIARLSVGGTSIEWIGVKPMGVGEGREEEHWIGFVDGGIVKVGAATGKSLTVGKRARINRLDKDLSLGKDYPLAYHAPTKSLVLQSSHPTTLQFFQPSTSTLLFDLEVIPSNRVTRADKELNPIRVGSVVFSPATAHSEAGQWMATYETRDPEEDQGAGLVRTIKLWFWHAKNGYVLNTQLDRVHGVSDVTSMSFAPSDLLKVGTGGADSRRGSGWLFLTTGSDGVAKVWTVKRGITDSAVKGPGKKQPAQEEVFWALRSSFSHLKSSITTGTFSPDGTLLVLSQSSVVSLWSTTTNTLLRTIQSPDLTSVAQMLFLGEGGRYLVLRGDREQSGGLGVWDLLGCGSVWTREGGRWSEIQCIPGSTGSFVVLDSGKKITRMEVFNLEGPVALERATVPFGLVQTIIAPGPVEGEEELNGLTRDGRVIRFGSSLRAWERGLPEKKPSLQSIAQGGAGGSIWEEMFGKETFIEVNHQVLEDSEENKKAIQLESRARYSKVFDSVYTTLPPSGLLFDTFVEDFMKLSTSTLKSNATTLNENTHSNKPIIPMSASNVGAGVRDVQREVERRIIPEREVGAWFSNLLGSGFKPTGQSYNRGTPMKAAASGRKETPLQGSKRRKSAGKGTPIRGATDDEAVHVGSKRKATE